MEMAPVFSRRPGPNADASAGTDLLNPPTSRGVKRERVPDKYEVPLSGSARDDGMSWPILYTCAWLPSTCLMLHAQGSATTQREESKLMALSRNEQIKTPGNAENR